MAANDGTQAGDPGTIGGGGANDPTAGSSTSTPASGNTSWLQEIFKNLSPQAAQAIGNIAGVGGSIAGTALQSARLSDAINWMKQLSSTAQGQMQPSYAAGWNAYANNNNVLPSIFDNSNPYMNLLSSGVVGNIGQLNNLLPQLTTGAGNLIYQDPTASSYLGLSTRPIDFLTGQAQAAGNLVGSGGQTANNSYLAQRSQDLSSMNPLLSTGQALSFAQDTAGRENQAAAQTARAQALNRGGGAGSVAGAGAQNGGLADFSDAALNNVASNRQNALLGQQGLNLQQVLGGLNAGQGASALQQSLLNTGLTQGANNALGASGLAQNAISQLLQGRTGASNIGSTLAQLYQGQNSQLQGAANSGISALMSAMGLNNQQGSAFLQNASQALNAMMQPGMAAGNMLKQSPTSNLLFSLGSMAGGSPNNWLGPLINQAGNVARSQIPTAGSGPQFNIMDPSTWSSNGGWNGGGFPGDPSTWSSDPFAGGGFSGGGDFPSPFTA